MADNAGSEPARPGGSRATAGSESEHHGGAEGAQAGQAERHFAWSDMFVHPDEDPRSQDEVRGERDTLTSYLTYYRQTLELKCAGLDALEMARRSVPPSNLSLLGLVRHLTNTEQYWFRRVLAGQDVAEFYDREAGDDSFDGAIADPDLVTAAWEHWRAEVTFADEFVAAATSLDVLGSFDNEFGQGTIEMREVLVHMIEEYARHCGHADFLRERIDGRVGQ